MSAWFIHERPTNRLAHQETKGQLVVLIVHVWKYMLEIHLGAIRTKD